MSIINKTIIIVAISSLVLLSACSNQLSSAVGEKNSQWDFDHKLQYKQTKLADNRYRIKVIKTSKVAFTQMTTFLMRQAYEVCGAYGYKIRVLQGIEKYTDKKAMPNLIIASLIAEVEC